MTKTDLSFSIEEYEGRLARVRELMRERSIDVAILDEIESMGWLSGFAVSENLWRACVVPFEGAPFMLIRSLDLPPARERSWFSDIISFTDWEDPVECLVAELGRRGFAQSRIGIDFYSQSMPHGRLEQLRRVCPHATIVDFGRGIWELRLKKSPAEIDHLRSAAAIVDAAMRVAIENVKLGSSQQDVAAAVAFAYHKLGADDAFIGPLTSGNDWDSLHGHLQLKPFTAGDVFHIELVPRVRGYSSRIMRSVVVGLATRAQQHVAATLVDLQDRQIAALRPGAFARDVDRIVRHGVLEQGLRASYDNVTGYTLGFLPRASQRSSDFTRTFTPEAHWTVETGMTFHMYTSARGLAFSETVVVTDDAPERLTKTERKLFESGG